jgi:hypothetical protein
LSLLEFERGIGSGILVSPILGAVFAIILYFFFAGGLVTGSLFPEFKLPLDGINVAKLVIWSFIAGFAERFVPDRLDQLSQQANPKVKRSAKDWAT